MIGTLEQQYFSLKTILEEKYLDELVDNYDLEHDDLKGATVKEKINAAIDNISQESELPIDLDNYVRSMSNIVFKMFDIVLGNSRKLLRINGQEKHKKRSVFKFNNNNKIFINMVIDFYQDDSLFDTAIYLHKRSGELSEDFKDLMYTGFIELAENENTQLTVDYVNRKWTECFNEIRGTKKQYKEINILFDELKDSIDFFLRHVYVNDENTEKYERIKFALTICSATVFYLSRDLWQSSLPDLPDIREKIDKILEHIEGENIKQSRNI